MDRIIEVKVRGNYLVKDNKNAGTQGEANVTALRIDFDSGWDGHAKTITWWDAKGENPVSRVLTADLLENLAESTRIYLTLIPGEAMLEWGECIFGIDGYINGKRARSAYGKLVVKPGAGAPVLEEVTPSQIEQLQVQIDTLLADMQAEAIRAEKAKEAAETAQKGAETAKTAAETAQKGAESAKAAAETAKTGAENAQKGAETAKTGAETAKADAEKAAQRAEAAVPSFPAGARVGDIIKIIQVKDGKPTKWMSIPFLQEFKNEVALLENSPIITSAEMKDRKTVRFKNAYANKVFDLDATPLAFICNSFAEKGQVPVVDAVDENGDPTEWSMKDLPNGIDVAGGAKVGQIIQVSKVDSSGKPTEWKAIDLPSGTGDTDGIVLTLTGGYGNYSVMLGDAAVEGIDLDKELKAGRNIIGVAGADMRFTTQIGAEYTVPSGTIFRYQNASVMEMVGEGYEFYVQLDGHEFALMDLSGWYGHCRPAQVALYLKDSSGSPVVYYNGRSRTAEEVIALLESCYNLGRPVLCWQENMVFLQRDGSTATPPLGNVFRLTRSDGMFYFRCEQDGVEYVLEANPNGFFSYVEEKRYKEIVLLSPNGTRFGITVDDNGTLTAVAKTE